MLTFYKELPIMLALCCALILHVAAVVFDIFLSKRMARALTLAATALNIVTHLVLIVIMMHLRIALNEAVLVMMISLFLHTLIGFAVYNVRARIAAKRATDEGGDGE